HLVAVAQPLSAPQIDQYYKEHQSIYAVPERRDVRILKTANAATAAAAKREISAGRSFASLADRASIKQPLHASHGLVVDLKPEDYKEPKLTSAIFHAKLNTLVGPVEVLNLGSFVFEVKSRKPARERSLAEVEKQLREEVISLAHKRVLTQFVQAWAAGCTA